MFVFGDFSIHHKNWLTYSGGTDTSGELCYIFSISHDLTQMVNCLFFWISFFFSDTSTCSKMTFPRWETLIMLLSQFTLNFCQSHKRMSSFTAYLDYSCVDWVGLHDHLRDVPLEDIFKLIEFCEWVHFFVCTNRENLLNLK